MKELSTEEKAKRYDEAIKVAKSNYETIVQMDNDCTFAKEGIINTFHHMFPEFKEIEDERIRKVLLNDFKNNCSEYYCEGVNRDMIITWLEKQGRTFTKKDVDDAYLKGVCDAKQELGKQGEQKLFDFEHANIPQRDFVPKSALEAIKEEKIDNANKVEPKDYSSIDPHFGKPIDKVEPKFKVGDWITNGATNPAQISSIKDGMYFTHNDTIGGDVESIDKEYHLWDISKDAKDGDVLVSKSGNKIFSYRGSLDLRGRPCAYYGIYKTYDGMRFTPCAIGNYFTYEEVYPATKEQRDALMKAMTDAKWEFDFEKKELKKIEQNTAWSKEDESYLNTTIVYLKDAKEFKKTAENCIDWLKSLKERCTWKPSGELDEASYKVGVKRVLENPESYGLTKYNWKPSDEQMSALSDINCTGCISYPGQGQELINLYIDLKKLKGE